MAGAQMTDVPEYLRARDIARLTGVSLRTARRWIAKEILASGKVGGARLVAKSELERLLSPTADEAMEDISDKNEHH
jgi:excisionase family DNA binding protein